MTEEEAANYRYDILDLTKDWLNVTYHEIGRITLTQNPSNYFAEIEQSHFTPGNMIPGWEPSADPVLQSRLFAYGDASRYRLGANADDIPVNSPIFSVANFDRDGHLSQVGNQGSRKNFPAEFIDPINVVDRDATTIDVETGNKSVYWESKLDESVDYEQPRLFYESFSRMDKDHLHSTIAGTLVNVDNVGVFDAILLQFGKISWDLEAGVRAAYAETKKAV